MAARAAAPAALYAQYFLCGATGEFPDIARGFYLREAGFEVDRITMVDAALAASWLVALPVGLASDLLKRRRAFVFAAQAGMAVAWAALLALPAGPGFLNAALFVFDEACVVGWSAVLDAMLVAHVREAGDTAPQFVAAAFYFAGRTAGALCGGIARSGAPSASVFAVQLGVVCAAALLARAGLREPAFAETSAEEAAGGPTAGVLAALQDARLRATLLFLVALAAVPSTKVVSFYFLVNTRGFSALDMGVVDAATFAAVAGAQLAYTKLGLERVEQELYICATLGGTLSALVTLMMFLRWNAAAGVPDLVMALAAPLRAGMYSAATAPYQGMLAGFAGERHQAFVYAVLGLLPSTGAYLNYAAAVELTRVFGVTHADFEGAAGLARAAVLLSLMPMVPLMWTGREAAAGYSALAAGPGAAVGHAPGHDAPNADLQRGEGPVAPARDDGLAGQRPEPPRHSVVLAHLAVAREVRQPGQPGAPDVRVGGHQLVGEDVELHLR